MLLTGARVSELNVARIAGTTVNETKSNMAKSHNMSLQKIYEGKAKILFEGRKSGTLIQHFKDDATAFNAQKHAVIEGKGVLNNLISEYIFRHLKSENVPTHFIRRINERDQLIWKTKIIPLEIVVRNVAAGSLAERLGIEEGAELPHTLVETYYKSDELNDPLVSNDHILAFGWASQQEIDKIRDMALKINKILVELMQDARLRLIDFKLEFGRVNNGDSKIIVLADEFSPDNCRLWDSKTNEKMDKDRFRRDLGGTLDAYQEVANRLGILTKSVDKMCEFQTNKGKCMNPILPQVENSNRANLKAKVTVTLKNSVLDPQGKAIANSLKSLGFAGVEEVRQGKVFDIELSEQSPYAAKQTLTEMCEKLLANLVIEDFNCDIQS